MAEKGYGEIKARAKIFPSDIDKFSEQGVGIALVQAKVSPKTKQKVKQAKTGGNHNALYYILQKTK